MYNGREHYPRNAVGLMLAVTLLSVPAGRAYAGAALYLTACGWGALIFIILRFLPAIRVPGQFRLRGAVLGYAASGAVFYLAISFIAGAVLKNLSASPYDTSAIGVLHNLIYLLPALVAREMARAYGLGAAWRTCRHRMALAALITLIMFLTELNFGRLAGLTDFQSGFIYGARNAAPALTQNILASVLDFYGGALAGIAYLGTIQLFQRLFPFLPDLPWIAQSAVGICFPLIYAMVVRERCERTSGDAPAVRKTGGTAGFLASFAAVVGFSWFCVGVFPLYPSVVLTGSMEPLIYPGDVVLVKKIMTEKEIGRLSGGDIINFKREDITITHRIFDVRRDEAGNFSFETKGDNNDSADEQPVSPNDINGTVIKVVPKIGLPVLILNSGEAVPEGVTDGPE